MTPSWYDVLDVAPDASTDEVRTAWRTAVADLDPTDRRFAVLNRAAKVLLDPEARAAHDAELADQDAADAEADAEDELTPGEAVPSRPVLAAPSATQASAKKKPAKKKPADKKPADKKPAEKKPAGGTKPAAGVTLTKDTDPADATRTTADATRTTDTTDPAEDRSPLWVALLAGLVAVLLAVVAVAAVVGSTSTEQLDEDVTEAQAAAEEAIVPVLSYDATDLEAGRSTALSYLTEDFGEEYAELFDGLIEGNAQEIGAQVQATLLASAVVRTDPEVERVQVLVFVDQQTTNDQLATPRTDSNQVTVTMERVGDEWLVDDLDTGTAG